MSDIEVFIEFLNATCTKLQNKGSFTIWGLEPNLIVQCISLFFTFVVGCKIYGVSIFNTCKSKHQLALDAKKQKKESQLSDIVSKVVSQIMEQHRPEAFVPAAPSAPPENI